MKMQLNKILFSIAILVFSIGASAGTRLCYVQNQDSEGVYKDVLAPPLPIDSNDFQNHLLLQEGEMMYTVAQSEANGKITVAMFSRADKSTLILASSNGVDGITLINESKKRLIGCSAVTENK